MYKLVDWINKDNLDYKELSLNLNAISFLEQNPLKIDWSSLSQNPNAIELLLLNQDKIDFVSLQANPNIHLIFPTYYNYQKSLKVKFRKTNKNKYLLSQNPNAIDLLIQYPYKINWSFLTSNPNAMSILEKHPKKIDLWALSTNPNAVEFLKQNPKLLKSF